MAELEELLTEALRDLAAEAPALPPLSPEARRRIRAGRAAAMLTSVVVVAAVCAGLVIGGLALSRGVRSRPHHAPNAVGWTATVRASIPIAWGKTRLPVGQEAQIAVLGSTAWVAEWDTGLIVGVDLATRRITKVLPGGSADGIAAGSGSVWVLDARTAILLRIAPATGTVISRIHIPGGATAVAYGDGFIWVTGAGPKGAGDVRLSKIDPARNVIVRAPRIRGFRPFCPVFPGPQGLWLGCDAGAALRGHDGITLIDPVSLKPLKAVPINTGGYGTLIAPGQRVVWVLTGNGLVRVDPATDRVTGTVKINWDPSFLPFQNSAFAVDRAGRVWVANSALDVLAPGSRTVHQVANTNWIPGIGIINVVMAGSHLWADTGIALVEFDVSGPPAKP